MEKAAGKGSVGPTFVGEVILRVEYSLVLDTLRHMISSRKQKLKRIVIHATRQGVTTLDVWRGEHSFGDLEEIVALLLWNVHAIDVYIVFRLGKTKKLDFHGLHVELVQYDQLD